MSKEFMDKQERSFVLGFVFILLGVCAILGLYFVRYSSDEMADKITAVASVFSVVVSCIAIFYVYRTYQTQREENDRLKRDTEFNRALELIYKQLELTKSVLYNDTYNRLSKCWNGDEFTRINITKYINENKFEVQLYVDEISEQFAIFSVLLNNSKCSEEDREQLRLSIRNNIPYSFVHFYQELHEADSKSVITPRKSLDFMRELIRKEIRWQWRS